jgi:hypothetical protein
MKKNQKKDFTNNKSNEQINSNLREKNVLSNDNKSLHNFENNNFVSKNLNKNDFELDKLEFNKLENFNADNILESELNDIYKSIQKKNENFKNNIFFKHLEHLFDNLGKFDNKKNLSHSYSMKNIKPILYNIITPKDLLNKYEKIVN